jgi:hypothetical protein
VILAALWHLFELKPKANTGVPTLGVIVTVWVEDNGPLQPEAVAVIIEVPVQPAVNVTSPVEEFIVFPPDKLAAFKE